jgi:hypothetical protein
MQKVSEPCMWWLVGKPLEFPIHQKKKFQNIQLQIEL